MSGIRKILNIGLEEWQPAPDVKYDLIGNQWYLGHLTDKQLVRYLKNCSAALEPRDGIVGKENLSTSSMDLYDSVDSTVPRS
ncbi:alpha-N-methyltransferase NTM1 [Xylaria flabelliformis]|nr:alpha-N-methyltransferase NTM1 [Xylaria flabelliformis]